MADTPCGAAAPIPAAVLANPVSLNEVTTDPVQLLRQFDCWLTNTGHASDHPWRLSIRRCLDATDPVASGRHAAPQADIERASSYGNSPVARATRMLALVDLAKELPAGDTPLPGDNDNTDRDDKLAALLHCLQAELEALHMEVSNGR